MEGAGEEEYHFAMEGSYCHCLDTPLCKKGQFDMVDFMEEGLDIDDATNSQSLQHIDL